MEIEGGSGSGIATAMKSRSPGSSSRSMKKDKDVEVFIDDGMGSVMDHGEMYNTGVATGGASNLSGRSGVKTGRLSTGMGAMDLIDEKPSLSEMSQMGTIDLVRNNPALKK